MATVALGLTGNEITDAVRTAGIEGDGRPVGSGMAIRLALENLHPNPGFETSLEGWAAYGSGTSIALSTANPKFGAKCCDVVGGIQSQNFAQLVSARDGAMSFFVRPPAGSTTFGGATFLVQVLDGSTVVGELTAWSPDAAGWADDGKHYVRGNVWFRPLDAARPSSIRFVRDDGGLFKLDGIMFTQSPGVTAPPPYNPPLVPKVSHNPQPYAHRDDHAPAWAGAVDLWPNGSFESGIAGWTAFGAGATPSWDAGAAYAGSKCLRVDVNGNPNIGVRNETGAISLVGGKTYALDVRVDAPPGTAFAPSAYVNGVRSAVDFAWVPSGAWGRKVLQFTPASSGPLNIYIGRNAATAMTFRVDSVRVWERPAGAGDLEIPTGKRSPGYVTVPAAGIMRADQIWVAWRSRINFGTDRHGPGSNRFFKWGTIDYARIEQFYAQSTDGWGSRRQAGAAADGLQEGGGPTGVDVPAVYDHAVTGIGRWRPRDIAMSVNGSGFDQFFFSMREVSSSVPDGANIPIIPEDYFRIGEGGQQDFLWFAVGWGQLTDADAMWLHGLGDAGPQPGDFAARHDLRFLWDGDGATAWKADPMAMGAVREIGGVGGGMIHAYVGRPVTVEFWTGATGDTFAPVVESGGPGGSWTPTFAALGGGWHSLTHTFGTPGRWYAVLHGSVSGQTLVAQVRVSPIGEAPAFTRVRDVQTIRADDINELQIAIEAMTR